MNKKFFLLVNLGVCNSKNTITYIHSSLQQVQKIRQLLKKGKFEDIDVGSVEEFQGQERLIIIVSTVRCNPEYLSLDFKHNLGFLRNPKVNTRFLKSIFILINTNIPDTTRFDVNNYDSSWTYYWCDLTRWKAKMLILVKLLCDPLQLGGYEQMVNQLLFEKLHLQWIILVTNPR